jgi:hypothetical protein
MLARDGGDEPFDVLAIAEISDDGGALPAQSLDGVLCLRVLIISLRFTHPC